MSIILAGLLAVGAAQDRVTLTLEDILNRTHTVTKTQLEESHVTDQANDGPIKHHDTTANSGAHNYSENYPGFRICLRHYSHSSLGQGETIGVVSHYHRDAKLILQVTQQGLIIEDHRITVFHQLGGRIQ